MNKKDISDSSLMLNTCPGCGSQEILCFEQESTIYKCNNCKLFFTNPRPTMSLFENYYTLDYYESLVNATSFVKRNEQRLTKILPYKSFGRLLDVSCGSGVFLNLASHYFECHGLDTAKASQNFIKKRFNRKTIVFTLEYYEGSKKYDVITMIHVLEHIYCPGDVLDKCVRLLKPDGVLVIAVPNNSFFPKRFKILLQRCLFKKNLYFPVLTSKSESHVIYFTDKSLNKVVNYHGFALVSRDIDPVYTKTSDTSYSWKDLYY